MDNLLHVKLLLHFCFPIKHFIVLTLRKDGSPPPFNLGRKLDFEEYVVVFNAAQLLKISK